MSSNEVMLSGIIHESLSNGKGLRRVLFAQGCKHNCKGCFNEHTHPFTGGKIFNVEELANDIISNPMLKGVTFSGGDPFEQAEAFSKIAKIVKENGKNTWAYTGYTYEYIMENKDKRNGFCEFIKYLDVIVDGKFEIDKKDSKLKFRGSSNQRIIDVNKSMKSGKMEIINL
ncbi:MAG: anaerobic ribonucleoside-triphosphate reductase activating protein [Clostridium sp.]|nr:anaerobic ribonucleoside-triphosphate reductase activating protein [Clostridium sp.]